MPSRLKSQLTDEQLAKLGKLLDCVQEADFDKFHKLMEHAESIDEVMNTAQAFGRVGRVMRKAAIWLAGFLVALAGVNTYLKGGIKGWLGYGQ